MPDSTTPTGPSSPGPASSPQTKHLKFPRQDQQQTNWCWAAVTAAIDHFMDPASTLKQCEIANFAVNDVRTRRRQAPVSGNCCEKVTADYNQQLSLHPPLIGIGRAGPAAPGILSFDQVREQIDKGVPIGVRIEWKDGTGHFVVISGYSIGPGLRTLMIQDPDSKTKSVEVPYDVFLTRYRGIGHWDETHRVAKEHPTPSEVPVRVMLAGRR